MSKTYFITRHAGAIEWARRNGIDAVHLAHLDPTKICAGDAVLGTLPVNVAAEVIARGARYYHLSLNVPDHARGHELSPDMMDDFGAVLEEYSVFKLGLR